MLNKYLKNVRIHNIPLYIKSKMDNLLCIKMRAETYTRPCTGAPASNNQYPSLVPVVLKQAREKTWM
jgi:hypothetical protein